MKRRLLAALCALCMLAGLAPALAEGAPLAPLAEAPLTAETEQGADGRPAPQLAEPAPADAPAPAMETADQPRGEDPDPFAALQSAISSADAGGIVTLDQDITMGDAITISKEITLNLNGRTLTAEAGKRHFSVTTGGNLTIQDNSVGANGALDGNNAGGGVRVENGGTFTLAGGAITDCTANWGGGVAVTGGTGEFNLSGGAITGCKATGDKSGGGGVYTVGRFHMTDGAITGCQAIGGSNGGDGGGVYVDGGSFDMKGGSIKGCQAIGGSNNGGDGGGVYLAGATVAYTMSGGTIGGKTPADACTAARSGGGMCVGASAKLSMSGSAAIQSCTAGTFGGGVAVVGNAYFGMEDGASITGCQATSGGGVGVSANGHVFEMQTGASITGCEATNGGGVYVDGGSFDMKGGAITGCEATNGGGVCVEGNDAQFTMNGGTIGGTGTDACTATAGGGVYLGTGATLEMSGPAAIQSCTAGTFGGGVAVTGDTSLTMKGGAITGCKAASGGGVAVTGGGKFRMQTGASITGCQATSGGGVAVTGDDTSGAAFTMGGGIIGGTGTNACTAQNGGGVYMNGAPNQFIMSNDAAIQSCTAQNGGGVYVYAGFFTMNGGSIKGCKAEANGSATTYGGGVYMNATGASMEISGAPVITGNTQGTDNPAASNVLLERTSSGHAKIQVTGGLTRGAAIGVRLWVLSPGVMWNDQAVLVDKDGAALGAEALGGYFTADDPGQRTQGTATIISGTLEEGKFQTAEPEPPTPITPDTGLSLDKAALELAPGETAKLKTTLTPAGATYKYIFWTSSDETIATVSDSGVVTALAEGVATVTAKSWYGHEAVCTVTVKAPAPPDEPDRPDPWPTEGLAGFVTRCYRVALGRDPDKAGHADWVRWLKDGTVDATSCTYGFVFSKEMNDKNLSDRAFVETLYRLFMDRDGEAAGAAFWTDYLKAGHTRLEVFNGFADSVEFARIKAGYGIQ